ncbi:unnamed protein product [Symbiodinium natans]|uniref:Uncharacterized protein n=1 Tax=Symbiodinium natans TaxID=878477 RepID=A0A812I8R4_9DINO|nr:unnamed protein product [Symbiodinium natans]
MALITEAFAVGAAPPTLPAARFGAAPRPAQEVPERGLGVSSAAVAATVLAAGVAAKRRLGTNRCRFTI